MTPLSSFMPPPLRSKQSGLSLVELMVAMVIGLIVSLAIFSTLQTFEGRKRTNTSINDIDQAGNYAIYAVDKWVRSAGSGFTQSNGATFGCTLTAAKGGTQILPRLAALPAPFASVNPGTTNIFKLAPILIGPGQTVPAVSAAGVSTSTSDILIIMAGASGNGEVATTFSAIPSATQLNVVNTVGFASNDLVLVTDLSSGPTGTACMLEQVAASFTGGATTALTLNSTGTNTYYGATINSKALTSYTDILNSTVFNLGNTANPPTLIVLGVGDNNTLFGFDLLQAQNPLDSTNAQQPFPIADGVFELHALYGIDSGNDGKIDTWTQATGNYTPANLTSGTAEALSRLKSIKAVRIGLIMRTSLQEKDDVAPASLALFGDLGSSLQYTRTLASSEKKYRYRTIETTVPLRNSIMLSE